MLVMKTQITDSGKFVAPDAEKIKNYLVRNAKKNILITMQDIGEKRTNKQLAYWFGVIVEAIYQQRLKGAGYTKIEAKAMCKHKALGTRTVIINGKAMELQRGLSDDDIDTLEMIIATWTLENWAKEIGVNLPPMVTEEEYREAKEKKNNS